MTQERKLQRYMPFLLLMLTAAAMGLSLLCKRYSGQIRVYYIFPLVMVMVGAGFDKWHVSKHKMYLVGCLFAGWYILTRIINGDVFLEHSWGTVTAYMVTYLFVLPFAWLNADGQKRRGMDLAAAVIAAAMLCGTILAFMSIFRGELLRVDRYRSVYGMSQGRLWINYHPNSAAILLMIGICAVSYLMARYRKVWMIASGILVNLTFFVALMLTVSRTVMVEVSLLGGAACFFWILRLKKPGSIVHKTMLAVIGFAAAGLLTYASFGALSQWYNKMELPASAKLEQTQTLDAAKLIPSAYAQTEVMERPIGNDLANLTGRTDIWKSGILMLKENPKMLAFGIMEGELDAKWQPYKTSGGLHMHNALLQTAVTVGLPGLLLALILAFAALKCSWKILISHRVQTGGADKILCLLMLVLLVNGITEPFLFTEFFSHINFVFFLCLGYCLEKERLLPRQCGYAG